MTYPLDASTFITPITLRAHQHAQHICQYQRDRQTAKQAYLNVLAASAVSTYLRCMGIETRADISQSVDPIFQTVMDTGALEIAGQGSLECRPVLPGQSVMHVPPEVWTDRLGYVAVQLDETLCQATLLGFIETIDVQEVPLDQLNPLDQLPQHLCQRHRPQVVTTRTSLSQWLEHRIDDSWRSLDSLLGSPQPALAFRGNTQLNEAFVQRAKLLDLGLQLDHQYLALLIAVTPTAHEERGAGLHDQVDVVAQLHPGRGMTYLPTDIEMSLLSDVGEALQNVRSRQYDNYIQLRRFRGIPGECFDIQVTWGNANIIETFVI